jgi:inhibitor of cysteine peptidase
MLKYKAHVFTFLVLCTALAACGLAGSDPAKLTEKDAGSTIHVKQGDIVEVALNGNPTTGYTWEQAPGSGDLLAQQGDPAFKADSNALGSGGIMTLRFKALHSGTAPLKLIYHRTFEPNVAPLHTFEATVVVDP